MQPSYLNRKKLHLLLLLTAICLPTPEAFAFIAGAKGTGMAKTGVAYPQDAFAAAYNPAGAVDANDRFDIGFSWLRNDGEAKVDIRHTPAIAKINKTFNPFISPDLFLGDFAINKTFNLTICDYKWDMAAGIVVYNQEYLKTHYKREVRLLGTTKPGMEYFQEVISPYFSIRICNTHAIGISLDVNLQRLKVNGLQQFSNAYFSDNPTKVTNNGYAYSSGVGASIGWKWEAYENLTFGLTYHSKVHMHKMRKYEGLLPQNACIDSPERWDVGLAFEFLPFATLTFDFEWINWQDVKSLHNNLVHDGRIRKLGSSDGPSFGFKNQLIYRFGIDYAASDKWTVRAGFSHSNSFIKKSETMLNMLTCETVKNIISIGFTYTIATSNEITFFYYHGFEGDVNGRNSIPYTFGHGEVDLSQSKNSLGISWGYLF